MYIDFRKRSVRSLRIALWSLMFLCVSCFLAFLFVLRRWPNFSWLIVILMFVPIFFMMLIQLSVRPCGHGTIGRSKYFYWFGPFVINECPSCHDRLDAHYRRDAA